MDGLLHREKTDTTITVLNLGEVSGKSVAYEVVRGRKL